MRLFEVTVNPIDLLDAPLDHYDTNLVKLIQDYPSYIDSNALTNSQAALIIALDNDMMDTVDWYKSQNDISDDEALCRERSCLSDSRPG